MSWLEPILNFRFRWRADKREERRDVRDERADNRAAKSELIDLIDHQIENVKQALPLAASESERGALSQTLRGYLARKDSILEASIQFHPAMPTPDETSTFSQLAPTAPTVLSPSAVLDAAGELELLAGALIQEEQWAAAAVVFHRLQRLKPGDAGPTYNRGTALLHAGRHIEGLAELECAIQMGPPNAYALNNRASVRLQAGQPDKALVDFDEALQLAPDEPFLLSNRATALGRLGRHAEALADLNRSLELAPDEAGVHYNRALALVELSRYQEGLADLDRSLDLEPDAVDVLLNRGALLSRLGYLERAQLDFERAAELRPDSYEAALARASNLCDQGRYQETFDACSQILALRADDSTTINIRAIALDHLGRQPEALEAYGHAIELEPLEVLPRLNRAALRAKMQDTRGAREDLAHALEKGDLTEFRKTVSIRARKHPYFEPLRQDPQLAEDFSRILDDEPPKPADSPS